MKSLSLSHATQWRLVRLGDVFTQRKQRGSAGLPVLSVTMDRGIVARDSIDRKMASSLPPEESLLVQPGDLVYNTMRMWQGAVGYSDREGVVSPAYVVCRPDTDVIDGQFMNCLFKSEIGKNKLRSFSHGLTEDRLRLYFDDFSEIPLRLPSLDEQRKIAKIIDTWSTALRSLEQVIKAKERRLKALMSRLLTAELSTSKTKAWPTARLDTLFEEVTRPIQKNTIRSLSITAAGGFIDRAERFSDRDAGRVLDHYTLLHRGEFAYNKGNSLEYPCGCIYRLESFQEGAVPGV